MEDEAWVADYFSVVGARNDGDLELLDPELHSPEMLKCVWEDAITDIAVVRTGKGEVCPEGYELIDRTPMGHDADLNHGSVSSWGLRRAVHLAVRRQHVSKRDDYIAEIQVVFSGDPDELPEGQGWEVVEKSASGKRANLNKGGTDALLAVRRAVRNLVDCPAAVCSVCVLLRNQEEHPPPGYRVIQKDLNRGKSGDVVQLGYQVGGALSTVSLPYRSMILDRYPEQDSSMFPFPGDQLPMFVYPKGMRLEQRSGRDTPKSSFFSFVFTNVHGCRTFTACLTFYEPMLPSAARRLTDKLFTCHQPENRKTSDTEDRDRKEDRDCPDHGRVGPEQSTQEKKRVGLHGPTSIGAGLSGLSQSGQVRPRSSTGSWPGGDLGAAASAGWRPRGFVRGPGGGVAGGGAPGHTPPSASSTSTSWSKPVPTSPAAGGAAAVPIPQQQQQHHHHRDEKERSLPFELSPAYYDGDGCEGGAGGRASCPLDGRRWEAGDIPFRDNCRGVGVEAGGMRLVAEAGGSAHPPPLAGATAAVVEAQCAESPAERIPTTTSSSSSSIPRLHQRPLSSAADAPVREASPSTAGGRAVGDSASNRSPGGSDDLSDEEYDLMCQREDRPCIFAPKTICVISRFPIYGVLRRFLRHLYAISLSPSGVPLERYISMFVSCIPMPPPGGCPFHVYLERLENQDPRRSRLKPLSVQRPPAAWLPLMDIDFASPFRCLSVQSVLTVFALMLQEAKILFLSSRAELLTQVMEALRSLLFPLEWQSVYVPQLPYALAGYLECPGGFMIGMRLTKGELERGTGGTATVVRDLDLQGMANAVNLDAGEVLLHSGHLIDSVATVATPVANKEKKQAPTVRKRGHFRGHQSLSDSGSSNHSIHSSSWPRSRSNSSGKSRRASSVVRQTLGGIRRSGGKKARNGGDSGIGRSGGGRQHSGAGGNSFIAKDEETATPWLPELLREGLAARLERELFGKGTDVRVGVEEELDQYESAFEFAPAPDRTDTFMPHFSSERIHVVDARGDRLGTAGTPAPTRHHGGSATSAVDGSIDTTSIVRDCFLCCMSELLRGICGSLRLSETNASRHSLRTKPLDELFNMSDFLEGMAASQGARPFLQRLTSTQMFWVLVQQWLGRPSPSPSSPSNGHLLFFEECAMAVRNRRAGAVVPWKDRGGGTADGGDDDGYGNDSTGERAGWGHDFIPLVDEVRLKRPDLYGLNSYNLYGSAELEGSRSTPLATPVAPRRPQTALWEPSARAEAEAPAAAEDSPSPAAAGDGPSNSLRQYDHHELKDVGNDGGGNGGVRNWDVEWEGSCQVCTGPPIIIPGPTAQGIAVEGQQPFFRYDDGWPTPLNRSLLHTPPEALPPVVLELQRHASSHSSKRRVLQQGVAVESESKSADIPSDAVAGAAVDPSVSLRPHAGVPGMSSAEENSRSQQRLSGGSIDQSGPQAERSRVQQARGYRGEARLWRPHGKGRMVYSDSTVYEGQFRQGRRHGQGTMSGGGNCYTGQWKMGKKDGVGTMTYPDGSRYEGDWSNDQRHGRGTNLYASGAVYEGCWEGGKMHGMGCYTGASGARYEGMYRRGVRRGHAKMTYSGGQTYIGEWADGVRSGFGTYTLVDRTVFEGHFKQGKKHGRGILRGAEGVTDQLWDNGKLVTQLSQGETPETS